MFESAFVSGFLKQAHRAGVVNNQNYADLEKYATEAALNAQNLPGAVNDNSGSLLLSLIGSNALGGMLGSNYAPISNKELEKEMAYKEDPSLGKTLKYLIPGYAGYRAAKNSSIDQAYQKYKDEHKPVNVPQMLPDGAPRY